MTTQPPTPDRLLSTLMSMEPQTTNEAPDDCRGIYGLVDHLGHLRYIGSTSAPNETFHRRIHHRHRTGSEHLSHYFSRMYNSGRMWRRRNDQATMADGKVAKRLRNAFIEAHCRAVWVPLPDTAPISQLEHAVISLAPESVVAWNRHGMPVYAEPIDLVDALIERLGLSHDDRAALNRQRERFDALGDELAPLPRAIAAHDTQSPTSHEGQSSNDPTSSQLVPPLPRGCFRFFALDVETANHDRASICQIGVACVRADDTIETWTTLVDPQTSTWAFTGLHGIGASDVVGAPTVGAVLDALEPYLWNATVYQHSSFDHSAIRAACAQIGRTEPSWRWEDSVALARRAWPELSANGGHGLASLKRHLGLRFDHHDAGEDARAAAEVVLRAGRVACVNPIEDSRPTREARTRIEPGRPDGGARPAEAAKALPQPEPTGVVVGETVLTEGNLKHSHFYLRSFLSAFPGTAIDASRKDDGQAHMLTVDWGHGISSRTDICGRHKFFRDRSNTRAFFERTQARAGDRIEVSRLSRNHYSVSLGRR